MGIEAKRIVDFLRAGYGAFWIKTQEPDRVQSVLMPMVKDFQRKDGGKYNLSSWDCSTSSNPLEPLNQLSAEEELTVKFLFNFHWFIDKPQVIQKIQNDLPLWASEGKAIVIVAPVVKVPVELQNDFTILNFSLPDEKEILHTISYHIPEGKRGPSENEMARLIGAAKGLTQKELNNVLSLSMVVKGKYDTALINEHKATVIEKTGFVEVIPPKINFSNVVGYEVVKDHARATMHNPKAKGFMVIGPPGCGKTTLMNAIVGESGKIGLKITLGKLFSKFQGETDANVDFVINLIKSIGDCVVLIDEFEKQFAGSSGDGTLDSGTTRRATGRWLEFLQDRPSGVFIVATANSFNGIPPEYLRPGRWDTSPFFIDLPNKKTQDSIFKYYAEKYSIEEKKIPKMEGWSGAEIEACCQIADMHGIPFTSAMRLIKPQSVTMKEQIDALRSWAKDRTINAEEVKDIPVKAGVVALNGKRKIDT